MRAGVFRWPYRLCPQSNLQYTLFAAVQRPVSPSSKSRPKEICPNEDTVQQSYVI